MLVYSFYESDNRVMRYARALVGRGDQVDVIALACEANQPAFEVLDGVNVHRIQHRQRNEKSKYDYFYRLAKFCLKSSFYLGRLHRKRKYDLVHVHNVPDFLVFSAWFPKMTGAKIILDIHDILPEFFASKFKRPAGSFLVRSLKWTEKVSAAFANHIILSNHLWLESYTARSAGREKCSVFINHVDTSLFRPRPPGARNSQKPVVIFPGGLQWHQGVDIAIRAFDKLRHRLPQAEFHIYGDGNLKPQLMALVESLGLQDRVRFFKPLRIKEIAAVMANADLGVVPKRADSFGNEAYSTKIMEFMSVNVPVVVSSTKIDRFYFNESVVKFFESGHADQLADVMHEVLSDAKLREKMVQQAAGYVSQNSWEKQQVNYLALVDALCGEEVVPSCCVWLASGERQSY